MKQFIMASGSPGRKELLAKTGYKFTVDASNYEEDMSLNLKPEQLAIHLSKGKAQTVAKRHKNAVILAADSFAVFKGNLLGKPHTKQRAKEMLSMLSGQAHYFITGFTIVDTNSGKSYSNAVKTTVYFRKLTQSEIDSYIDKEDVLEKAASYIAQGLGAILIEKVDGSYSNITGLPLAEVAAALKDFGIYLV
jgi:septum formation protein